jgi:hypothetical protein
MESLEMSSFAVKITMLILYFVFSHYTFASFSSGWCERVGKHTHENVREFIDEDEENGTTRTRKYITINYNNGPHDIERINEESRQERIITIHDSRGSLLLSRHYTWINKILAQTIEDGIVRNIVKKTPCDYIVIEEPSKDTVFFHFHPKKRITNTSIRSGLGLAYAIKDPKHKFHGKYDVIIYELHSYCKENSDGMLDLEEEQEIIEPESSNYFFPYKYYAIIIICIAIACIIMICKKRKSKR